MSRVTRATSRAEAEFHQNSSKADAQNLNPEGFENMNESMSAAVTVNSDEPFKADTQKPKRAKAKAKTMNTTGNRQPLGDIALNAVDDDVKKREKNAKEQTRSNNDNAESEGIDLSVEDETEIRVNDWETENKQESASAEFMEPSVLEAVEEVNEEAGDEDTKESFYAGKDVESLDISEFYHVLSVA